MAESNFPLIQMKFLWFCPRFCCFYCLWTNIIPMCLLFIWACAHKSFLVLMFQRWFNWVPCPWSRVLQIWFVYRLKGKLLSHFYSCECQSIVHHLEECCWQHTYTSLGFEYVYSALWCCMGFTINSVTPYRKSNINS